MSNPAQLFLLADHLKLSLLERQRAITLDLEPNTQDAQIERSLAAFKNGLEKLKHERELLEESQDPKATEFIEQEKALYRQYSQLAAKFHGELGSEDTPIHSNTPSLEADFAAASGHALRPHIPSNSSFKGAKQGNVGANSPKSVRFSDNAPRSSTHVGELPDPNRSALFPYKDDPADEEAGAVPDQRDLSEGQIHQYHQQVMAEQDEQLDRLGESIGRQRELSIQIGDELDSHAQLLDEVDEHVDRHQSRLDGARKRLGTVARKAKDNKQLTIILVLIVVLVLLIILLKG